MDNEVGNGNGKVLRRVGNEYGPKLGKPKKKRKKMIKSGKQTTIKIQVTHT